MEDFNKKLKEEVKEFRNIGHKFLNREITKNEFKGKSGGMGVYAQRAKDQFMIRLRTPSGIISHKHLNLIQSYTEKYNLDCIHLTTRQAIQLHDLSIDNVCDIMDDAIDNELYARGSGGNFPRNVSMSPLSGVEKGEAFDVTPYAQQVGDFLLERITTYHLPRKLKIAFSNSDKDTGKASLNDLGFLAVIENGKPYFKVYLAGGMGNNPAVAIEYTELISPEDVLYHVEAITQLFIAEGDYENKAKARIRYIPRRMGVEAFIECYEKHLDDARKNIKVKGIKPVIKEDYSGEHSLNATNCLIPENKENRYTVILHPVGGQLLKEDLKKVANFIKKTPKAEIRLSMEEAMYIRNLTKIQAEKLLARTANMRQVTKIGQSVSCIGTPTCQLGIEKSQELLQSILKTIEEKNIPQEYLPSVNISGCTNSCTRHQVTEMGFAGGRKRVNNVSEEVFELHVGGFYGRSGTKLGKIVGPILTREIPNLICELGIALDKAQMPFRDYLNEKESEFLTLTNKYVLND